jgi:hypothetical protein
MVRVAMFTLALAAATHAAAGQRQTFERNVRTEDAGLRELIRDARSASPTFRELLDRLEGSDIIVHVARRPDMRVSLEGQLNFVARAGGRRYLRVAVAGRLPARRLVAIVAHELQHAVEIADDGAIVDAPTLAQAYRRLADRSQTRRDGVLEFETRTAIDVAARVWREYDSAASADD